MQHRSVEQDFTQIERFVRGFDRKGTRALAIFSSSGSEIWEVFPLARRVQDRLVVDTHPHIRPLSRLLNECKRCATVLLSRDRATINMIHLGEIQQLGQLTGDVASQIRESGYQGRAERRIERRSDDQLLRFIKEVAAEALTHHMEHQFDYLLVGGSQGPVATFESVAHQYLTDRMIGRLPMGPGSGPSQVLDEVSTRLVAHEDGRGLGMIQRVIREMESGGVGVVGIEPTLMAISEGRVATLVVAKGTFRPGVACTECPFLGVRESNCPQCETDLLPVPDVIEEAVDRSLGQSAEVLFVREHERLTSSGGLAALLRYR